MNLSSLEDANGVVMARLSAWESRSSKKPRLSYKDGEEEILSLGDQVLEQACTPTSLKRRVSLETIDQVLEPPPKKMKLSATTACLATGHPHMS